MTLVERFIDFGDWPASRKTALAAVGASTTHLFGAVVVLLLWCAPIDAPAMLVIV
jgi:hypothetical protein